MLSVMLCNGGHVCLVQSVIRHMYTPLLSSLTELFAATDGDSVVPESPSKQPLTRRRRQELQQEASSRAAASGKRAPAARTRCLLAAASHSISGPSFDMLRERVVLQLVHACMPCYAAGEGHPVTSMCCTTPVRFSCCHWDLGVSPSGRLSCLQACVWHTTGRRILLASA